MSQEKPLNFFCDFGSRCQTARKTISSFMEAPCNDSKAKAVTKAVGNSGCVKKKLSQREIDMLKNGEGLLKMPGQVVPPRPIQPKAMPVEPPAVTSKTKGAAPPTSGPRPAAPPADTAPAAPGADTAPAAPPADAAAAAGAAPVAPVPPVGFPFPPVGSMPSFFGFPFPPPQPNQQQQVPMMQFTMVPVQHTNIPQQGTTNLAQPTPPEAAAAAKPQPEVPGQSQVPGQPEVPGQSELPKADQHQVPEREIVTEGPPDDKKAAAPKAGKAANTKGGGTGAGHGDDADQGDAQDIHGNYGAQSWEGQTWKGQTWEGQRWEPNDDKDEDSWGGWSSHHGNWSHHNTWKETQRTVQVSLPNTINAFSCPFDRDFIWLRTRRPPPVDAASPKHQPRPPPGPPPEDLKRKRHDSYDDAEWGKESWMDHQGYDNDDDDGGADEDMKEWARSSWRGRGGSKYASSSSKWKWSR